MVTCEEGWMAASFGGFIHNDIASRFTKARKEGVVEFIVDLGKTMRSSKSRKLGLTVLWNQNLTNGEGLPGKRTNTSKMIRGRGSERVWTKG